VKRRVLVIGDACIDEYRFGSIERLNPEAPVPLLSISQTVEKMGMAANVADNLKALGAEVDLIIPPLMSRKVRYVEQRTNKHLLRVDEDICPEPYCHRKEYLYDAVVVSDYNKGFVGENLIEELQGQFKGPIFVDTKKTWLKSYDNVYYKINKLERDRLTNTPKNLIVTLGAKGCEYQGKVFSASKVEAVDVCGAGDVFLAALTFGYLEICSIPAAIRLANKAAAISCKHIGTYALTPEDVSCVF
jgi:D-glycero-beta-D-manno-heptose-7-phosphate kinase